MKMTPELAARLMAIQACYEMLSTQRALKILIDDYMKRGLEVDEDSKINTKPKSALFKKIMADLDDRLIDVDKAFKKHTKESEKDIEPLLKAIVFCGLSELMVGKEDKGIIINDYLNATHSFYEQGQVSFINGILDSASSTSNAS